MGIEDNVVQILSPIRKGSTGINNLNKAIPAKLISYSISIFEYINEVEFSPENREKLDLAYAFIIHKSQRSEYRAIVIPVSSNHTQMLTRKLLYT